MRIGICEDNDSELNEIYSYLNGYLQKGGYEGEILTYTNAEELIADFSPGFFDVIFLDVYLPGKSGIDAAREIRDKDADCLMVFITVTPDFSMDGFMVQASGYVLKPVDGAKLDKVMYMLKNTFEQAAKSVRFIQGGEEISFTISKIEYIEVSGKYSLIHMTSGMIEIRLSLNEIEQKLTGGAFLRCHKSFLVNMNYVSQMQAEELIMKSGALIPIRKNGRKQTRLHMAKHIAGHSPGVSL